MDRALMTRELFDPLRRKQARMALILSRLSITEREALFRFYNLEESPTHISHDLGIAEDQLRELRARVRSRFLADEQSQ